MKSSKKVLSLLILFAGGASGFYGRERLDDDELKRRALALDQSRWPGHAKLPTDKSPFGLNKAPCSKCKKRSPLRPPKESKGKGAASKASKGSKAKMPFPPNASKKAAKGSKGQASKKPTTGFPKTLPPVTRPSPPPANLPTSPPQTGVVAVPASPFTITYSVETSKLPTQADFDQASSATCDYLKQFLIGFLAGSPTSLEDFVCSPLSNDVSPIQIGYQVVVFLSSTRRALRSSRNLQDISGTEALDEIIVLAFLQPAVQVLIDDYLKELPRENVFSSTFEVFYAPIGISPTAEPVPTIQPTANVSPTRMPIVNTDLPSIIATSKPTPSITSAPTTAAPTGFPTGIPAAPTGFPTGITIRTSAPTPAAPTGFPTGIPAAPTGFPTGITIPTSAPTTAAPTGFPTAIPAAPTGFPTAITIVPAPTAAPTALTGGPNSDIPSLSTPSPTEPTSTVNPEVPSIVPTSPAPGLVAPSISPTFLPTNMPRSSTPPQSTGPTSLLPGSSTPTMLSGSVGPTVVPVPQPSVQTLAPSAQPSSFVSSLPSVGSSSGGPGAASATEATANPRISRRLARPSVVAAAFKLVYGTRPSDDIKEDDVFQGAVATCNFLERRVKERFDGLTSTTIKSVHCSPIDAQTNPVSITFEVKIDFGQKSIFIPSSKSVDAMIEIAVQQPGSLSGVLRRLPEGNPLSSVFTTEYRYLAIDAIN